MTHTGQPGPEMSSTPGGRRVLRPKRAAAMVWVPQTSMTVAGVSVKAARAARRRARSFTSAWSRNSSINFIGQVPEEGEGLLGMFGIHPGDGQTGVNKHVIPQDHLREQIEAHLARVTPSTSATAVAPSISMSTHGNGKAHNSILFNRFSRF